MTDFILALELEQDNRLTYISVEKRWYYVYYTGRECFSRTNDSGEKKKENKVSEVKLHREMASVRLSFQTCCFCLIKIVNVQSFKDSGNVKGSSLYFITQDIWSIHQNYFCWNLAQRLICLDFNSEIQHGRLIL